MPKNILGTGHSPKIKNGVYQFGSTTTGRIMCKSYNMGTHPSYKTYKSGDYRFLELSIMRDLATQHPLPRRREAIEHTRRKLGLL